MWLALRKQVPLGPRMNVAVCPKFSWRPGWQLQQSFRLSSFLLPPVARCTPGSFVGRGDPRGCRWLLEKSREDWGESGRRQRGQCGKPEVAVRSMVLAPAGSLSGAALHCTAAPPPLLLVFNAKMQSESQLVRWNSPPPPPPPPAAWALRSLRLAWGTSLALAISLAEVLVQQQQQPGASGWCAFEPPGETRGWRRQP